MSGAEKEIDWFVAGFFARWLVENGCENHPHVVWFKKEMDRMAGKERTDGAE